MNKSLILNRNLISFGIPLVLFGVLIFLMKSSFITGSDSLNFAITVDLILLVPVVYFLLIRRTTIPKTTVIPVMLIGLLIGTYFLPQDDQTYLNLFITWALPVIELSVITFIIIKVRSAVKKFKTLKGSSPDFFSALKSTSYEILPSRLAMPFATEVAVFYYGFINWKKRTLAENEFSYHKDSATLAILGVLILVIGIETFALHILISRWSITAAYILSGISVYTGIQIFGFAKSLTKRPISINDNSLSLKYGILNEVEIPFFDIETIELSSKSIELDDLTRKLSPFGELESHNVVITLKNVNQLFGLYGIKKKFNVLGLHMDKPKEFKEKMMRLIDSEINN